MKNLKNALMVLWNTSKGYFVFTFLLSISLSIPGIINVIVWKKIIDIVVMFLSGEKVDYLYIIFYLSIHFLFKVISDILNRISEYIKSIYSRKIEKYVTNETIESLRCMNLKDIEDAKIHNTIQKATEESSGKMMGLLSKAINLIQNITLFTGMSGILISFNYKIYIVIFISIIPMALYSQRYFNKLYDVYNKRVEKIRFSNELKKMVSNSETFKEIKIFNNLSYLKFKINEVLDDIISEDKNTQKELNMQGIFSKTIEVFFIYILKVMIIILGIKSKVSIGTINMNMDSATQLQSSMSNIVFILISMHEDCLYLSGFTELLEFKNKIILENKKNEEKLIKNYNVNTIELVDICFKYIDDQEYILKNINQKFIVGNTYAIVGYNGGGKSTLVKIIMGLYKPQSGKILINGINIEEYDQDIYREKLSVVFQDFVKYPLTVRENIAMGNIKEIDNDVKIRKAAEEAVADTFIDKLMNGYEEKLVRGWENSSDLSIGQWQRIAIARSNLREGTIIIFDEPSAALDAKTESRILSHVINTRSGKIAIIITHRFLNIKKADEIIVLKNGMIDDRGKHEKLLETSVIYSELYHSQKEMI